MPGQSGLDQVNVALTTSPSDVSLGRPPEGCRVPLYILGPTSTSQLVNVSIHSGGGSCSDSPSNSLGLVTWEQTTLSSLAGSSSSNAVTSQFLQSPRLNFILPPAQGGVGGATFAEPTFCAAAYPTTLDAGTITISGGGTGALSIPFQAHDGITSYNTALTNPPGGAYTITATGSASGVGPFTAAATIPPPITITNILSPGNPVSVPFTLNWTGGDTRSLITVTIIDTTNPGQADAPMVQATVLGDTGSATARQFQLPFGSALSPAMKGPGAEIIVTQQPAISPTQPFSASGLSLGGAQSWKYVWDFRDLSNQSSQ